MRDAILELLRENKGEFVSGQRMSERCKVSRTAIWKHIEALRKKGILLNHSLKKVIAWWMSPI